MAISADLSNRSVHKKVVQKAEESIGSLDILVNNAGFQHIDPIDQFPLEMWEKMLAVMLTTPFLLTKYVWSSMKASAWGRIVNITSTSVKQPVDGLILSNSIRMAVVGWAKALANEVGPDQVVVNNVCPGYTTTDRLGQLASNIAARDNIEETQVFENWAGLVPLRRLASPEEFANVVVFLASEEAAYVHGTTIAVDGGRSQSVT